jgi:hypothetical protein
MFYFLLANISFSLADVIDEILVKEQYDSQMIIIAKQKEFLY